MRSRLILNENKKVGGGTKNRSAMQAQDVRIITGAIRPPKANVNCLFQNIKIKNRNMAIIVIVMRNK